MTTPIPVSLAPGRSERTALDALVGFVEDHPRLLVLTGAGVSTDSGIPDYRDAEGRWKHRRPVNFQDFIGNEHTRRRYWARSLIGWPRVLQARPGPAHQALARLEEADRIGLLVTQNVDGLHQRAGSREVIDLHGRLDWTECLGCHRQWRRPLVQEWLEALNPEFLGLTAAHAPDGDALLESVDFHRFQVPPCPACGGMIKPGVVFFGENVPKERVTRSLEQLACSDALLVVGSSLMVYSGFRYCRVAAERGLPMAAVNLGRTRADDLLTLKVPGSCGTVLEALVERLNF